jgi:two-component system phosphate regulon sensor histidine kinase PhoR
MVWVTPRVVAAVTWVSGLTGAGLWGGAYLGLGQYLGLLGAAIGTALVVGWDTWHGVRLHRWLNLHPEQTAPTEAGLWGGLGVRMERALRQREAAARREQARLMHFLQAIEASPNGMLLLDAHEQIEWCSATAAEHLGLDAQRDLRQHITNLVRMPAFVKLLHGGASGDEGPVVSVPHPSGRGTILVTLRRFGEGQQLLLTQDVTERERNEAMRRNFVANVSHEIRTPLTVLAGFIETMSNLPLTEVERRRVLTLMEQQSRRMQSLVGDLLALARLEGSPRPPLDHWVALDKIGQAIEVEARALSAGRHVFSFDWGFGTSLAGNEGELQSALANLVNNAVRYTPGEGATISVRCEPRADGGLAIHVQDGGPGIAAEHIPRLTERFYRVDGSRSRETGGTGLGLSIVKHVSQRHGGELHITSELGRGSCFSLLLPASRCRLRSSPAEQSKSADTASTT